jgi:hypothetical protein
MPNTLGLDDDLDPVEVVQLLERVFDIEVSQEEAGRILTVGDFYDAMFCKIPPDEGDRKCAGAMAFNRIRAALRRLGYGDRLTPASDMNVLERGGTKSHLKKLEKESGLRMPGPVATRMGCLASLCAFVAILAGVFSLQPGFAAAFLSLLAGLIAAGAIVYADPGKLPADCRTLAGLAKRVAAMNYGRLVKMGARHGDDDIWENLTEALSDFAAVPKSEITRETFFLTSQFKKCAAA